MAWWPWVRRGATLAPLVHELSPEDYPAAAAIMDQAPLETVLMRGWLDAGPDRLARGQRFLGLYHGGNHLQAVCWSGANIIPWGFDTAGLELLARRLSRTRIMANSIVGAADQVLGLWERVQRYFRQPREVRPHQLSMVWQGSRGDGGVCPSGKAGVGAVQSHAGINRINRVRPAFPQEFDLVLPASVAMFTEELGYDPTESGGAYAQRARELVAAERTFVQIGRDWHGAARLEFKADIGALAGGVAQIQGVYVPPELRGQGIASAGMAAVAAQVSARYQAQVHLYVNDFNLPAVRAYEKAGFVTAGEYATVLL